MGAALLTTFRRTLWCPLLAALLSLSACTDQSDPTRSEQQPTARNDDRSITQSSNQEQPSNTAWGDHIQSAPRDWVSAHSPLMVHFSHPVAGDSPLGQSVESVVAVEPPLDIKTSFNTDSTLAIVPQTPLERGVSYRFTIFPNQLAGVKDSLSPYQFTVRAYQQDFGIQVEGLQIDGEEGTSISGQILLSDGEPDAKVEAILNAQQEGRPLNIRWQHLNPTQHRFHLENIQRGDQSSSVLLRWRGAEINVDKEGSQNIPIPALQSFTLVGASNSSGDDQFINLNFSQPLDRRQSFAGLITIDDQAPSNVRVDGSVLRVYPQGPLTGRVNVRVQPGIRSANQGVIEEALSRELVFLQQKPGVRFKNDAHILPSREQVVVPIEAVNVDAVQITAYRLPKRNLGQFLQYRNIQQEYIDQGTTVASWRKTFRLPEIPQEQWQTFNLDLSEHLEDVGDDLFALEISINQSHSILDCGARPAVNDEPPQKNVWPTDALRSPPNWVQQYYQSNGRYEWRDRDNPCKAQYYEDSYNNKVRDLRYLHHSNIGLMAKLGSDQNMAVVATRIDNAEPIAGLDVVAYNMQHQPVAQAKTNGDGMASFKPVSAPYYLIASQQKGLDKEADLSFLRLQRNEALSTNVFDVGGELASSGIKGFFYGERGVWRPGDDIYLTFLAFDRNGDFPDDHPLTLDFFDPRGNKFTSLTNADPVNGFYRFDLRTPELATTGNWRAVIRYGGQYFDKVVPVEAIVPNRLKIELEFDENALNSNDELSGQAGSNFSLDFFSQWLNGASAADLRADLEMSLRPIPTRIAGFDNFVFDDPARKLQTEKMKVFDGRLDGDGRAQVRLQPQAQNAPGKLRLDFTARVFEKSGNFSTQYVSMPYLPYEQVVGLAVPRGEGWGNSISRDETHNLQLVTLDADGKAVPNVDLDFEIYRVDWRWWWDQGNDDLQNFVSSQLNRRIVDENLRTDANGRANWQLRGSDFEWGRYFVRVCHKASLHCAGELVYLGWSYNQQKNPSGDTQLILATDKDRYQVGDTAYLTIPQLSGGSDNHRSKLLLSIESGSALVRQQWIESEVKNGRYAIPITADMAPNVYAHITLVQAYETKTNDSPLRLYGVIPLHVSDPESRLSPVITAPEEVRPESELSVQVKEENGKAMTYTLALVDEGLLGITNFQTPNPHGAMYKREALGVLSWDMFDLIARDNALNVQRLITIGGSDSEADKEGERQQRRFPPVVKFMGPFSLGANGSREHRIALPEYMGGVRVMVVAGQQTKIKSDVQAAFGNSSKTVRVSQPLTLLATLPRVLGPNEEVDLPINVFVTSDSIKQVELRISDSENFIVDQSSATVNFDSTGDQIIRLPLKTANTIGTGSLRVEARSGNEVASQTIHIPIRSANLPQTVSAYEVIPAGESRELSVQVNGMLNTNQAHYQISRIPRVDLESRLEFLIGYPHGCLEQSVSRVFPQLHLPKLTQLSSRQAEEVESNINAAISKLQLFQNGEGDFNYWPHDNGYSNNWANSYAGHFLIEAKNSGYFVPADLFNRWVEAQKRRAQNLNNVNGYESSDAYTLYNLVLANAADFNAMNRLKEKLTVATRRNNNGANERLARWLLAAAYAKAGVGDAARELMSLAENSAVDYQWAGYSYGSRLRDKALLTITQRELGNDAQAWRLAEEVARDLSSERWHSTQTTAWALMALATYAEQTDMQQSHALALQINEDAEQKLAINSAMFRQDIEAENTNAPESIKLSVSNEGSQPLYALLANTGVPANQQEQASSQGVRMEVSFSDVNGAALDIANLPQGQDFIARVRVQRTGDYRLENMALTMVMPSGWQISNQRMAGAALPQGIEYQDIRDDRVLSYFTLGNYYYWQRNNPEEITVEVTLNASYAGRFYLPGWQVASMYDEGVGANTVGRWVEVR